MEKSQIVDCVETRVNHQGASLDYDIYRCVRSPDFRSYQQVSKEYTALHLRPAWLQELPENGTVDSQIPSGLSYGFSVWI